MFLTGSACFFPLTVLANFEVIFPRYAGQLHSLE